MLVCPQLLKFCLILVFHAGKGNAHRKLALIGLHILIIYLTSYLVEEPKYLSGEILNTGLDVAKVLATRVKGVAGQVINTYVVLFPDYFSGPPLISFLF